MFQIVATYKENGRRFIYGRTRDNPMGSPEFLGEQYNPAPVLFKQASGADLCKIMHVAAKTLGSAWLVTVEPVLAPEKAPEKAPEPTARKAYIVQRENGGPLRTATLRNDSAVFQLNPERPLRFPTCREAIDFAFGRCGNVRIVEVDL